MPDGNPFASFFFKVAHRQLLFLAVMAAFTMLFAFYGYGASWITFGIVLVTVLVLGLYAGLIWFWKGVFGSMLNKDR
jgi:hypothetical protein